MSNKFDEFLSGIDGIKLEFVNDLINDDVETFSVTDMLKNM